MHFFLRNEYIPTLKCLCCFFTYFLAKKNGILTVNLYVLQVLQDVTKEEFILIMDVLRSQNSMSTVQGRQQLVEIVTEQADLDQTFEVSFDFTSRSQKTNKL